MKKPLKAALFSALIFPGAGQLLLKKYTSAFLFGVVAVIGLYLLLSNLMARVQEIVDKIQSGEVSPDLVTIIELVNEQSLTSAQSLSPAFLLFMIAWLVSIIEAYRVGKKED